MREEDIRIGDVLRIRQWEDMEAEFGVSPDGDIPCADTFTEYMRELCGRTFTVKAVHEYPSARSDYDAEEPEFDRWLISADMLEPVTPDEEITPVEPDSLFGFLLE